MRLVSLYKYHDLLTSVSIPHLAIVQSLTNSMNFKSSPVRNKHALRLVYLTRIIYKMTYYIILSGGPSRHMGLVVPNVVPHWPL